MKKLLGAIRIGCVMIGVIALGMVILALTSAPFWIWYGLGIKKAGIHRPPDFIVVMGGSGMPSESGLMRCWYAAKVAERFTKAQIIIALPGDSADKSSSINGMKDELIFRGIAPSRIMFEDSGTNTRAQAVNIFKRISNIEQIRPSSLVIVTSPEHLYRAVLTFKKAGFLNVDGFPAFEKDVEGDLSFNITKHRDRNFFLNLGDNITLRYQFWSQLHYEALIIREWIALLYYKLSGWI
ncbi:MAG: YdcF family protein [Bacteroidetes bacterium]|nr:YdcF family protein [Bacteroidota bacterium]